MERPNIVLTGFMGTGKTTVGKLLSKQLDYEFIDTDHLIEQRAGKTITEIFKEMGEPAFREMEAAIARELSARQGVVISTGGRLMLDPENAAALSRTGRVFCLVATPEEIFERVTKNTDTNVRPLLSVSNPMERIVELIQERQADYGRFAQIVTSDKTPEVITKNLIGLYQSQPDQRFPITAPQMRYEFIVGGSILPFVTHLAGIVGPAAIITDTNVGARYGQSCGAVDAVIEVSPGQRNKTLSTVQSICEQLIDKEFDRSSTIIGLGGSAVIGLAGFVASIYMRGVDSVHCPTTLLAMVDTAIGGKTGINMPQGKNLIGTFKQPKTVIADIATLQSLSPNGFAYGMAEVVKHGLIAGGELFQKIESGKWKWATAPARPSLAMLQDLVAQAIQVKIQIVQEDPFQQGCRDTLNLGHTFAHAIEQASGHAIHHGDAVAMGLVAAANMSARLGYCGPKLQERLEAVLIETGLPKRIPGHVDLNKVLDAMRRDKKAVSGRPRFVLLRDIGDVFITDDVTHDQAMETLNAVSG